MEAYFLSAFHLIEACAAKVRVHINKHQKVRNTLEENGDVLQEDSETVWRNFQFIENQKRPKFAYSMAWTNEDMKEVVDAYGKIVEACLKHLK